MHEVSSWLTIGGIATTIVAVIVFTILAIRNKNMKFVIGKDGPSIETKPEAPPPPSAGDNNISDVNIRAHDVPGGIRIGHDNPGKK